jgi:hypothetical protein
VNRLVKVRALLFHESIRPRYVKVARGRLWAAQATIATFAAISTLMASIFERNLWFIPLSVLVWVFAEGIMRANLFLYQTFRG